MGRTLRTMNMQIQKEESYLTNFRRALWKEDQKLLDELFVAVKKRGAVISMIDHAVPFEAMLLAMMLEQQADIKRLRMLIEKES